MRLYSRIDANAVSHAGQLYKPGDEGAFDVPEHIGRELVTFHAGGRPLWETDISRQNRLIGDEMARRKDPATLYEAVELILKAAQAATSPEPQAKTPVKAAAAKPADGK